MSGYQLPDPPLIEARRTTALDAACRIAPPGTPTSGVLSRADEIDTYLSTGLTRSGGKAGITITARDFAVTICGPEGKVTREVVERLREAIEDVIA